MTPVEAGQFIQDQARRYRASAAAAHDLGDQAAYFVANPPSDERRAAWAELAIDLACRRFGPVLAEERIESIRRFFLLPENESLCNLLTVTGLGSSWAWVRLMCDAAPYLVMTEAM